MKQVHEIPRLLGDGARGLFLGGDDGTMPSAMLRVKLGLRLLVVYDFEDDKAKQGEAVLKLSEFMGRATVTRKDTHMLLQTFPSGTLQLVFINRYPDTVEAVRTMLSRWWAKVAPGGMLAGTGWDLNNPHVLTPVKEFADGINLRVGLTTGSFPRGWFLRK